MEVNFGSNCNGEKQNLLVVNHVHLQKNVRSIEMLPRMFLLLYIYCGRTHGLLTNVDHLVLAYWLPTFLMKVEALLWQSEGNSDQAPFKDWFRFSYGDSITRLTELNSHFYQPSSQFIGMVWGLLSSHSHPIWTLMCRFSLQPPSALAPLCLYAPWMVFTST